MSAPVDIREAKLPKWAQLELRQLRDQLARAQATLRTVQGDGSETWTEVHPLHQDPIFVPDDSQVYFLLPGQRRRARIEVYRAPSGDRIIVRASDDRLRVLAESSNVMLLETVPLGLVR